MRARARDGCAGRPRGRRRPPVLGRASGRRRSRRRVPRGAARRRARQQPRRAVRVGRAAPGLDGGRHRAARAAGALGRRRGRARRAGRHLPGHARPLGARDRRRRRRQLRLGPHDRRAAVGRPPAGGLRLRPRRLRPHDRGLRGPRAPRRPRAHPGGARGGPGAVLDLGDGLPRRPPERGDALGDRPRPSAARCRRRGRADARGGVRLHRPPRRPGAHRTGPRGDVGGLLLPRPRLALHLRERRGRAPARPAPRGAARRRHLGAVPRGARQRLRGQLPRGGRDRRVAGVRGVLPGPARRLVRAAGLAVARRPLGLLPRHHRATRRPGRAAARGPARAARRRRHERPVRHAPGGGRRGAPGRAARARAGRLRPRDPRRRGRQPARRRLGARRPRAPGGGAALLAAAPGLAEAVVLRRRHPAHGRADGADRGRDAAPRGRLRARARRATCCCGSPRRPRRSCRCRRAVAPSGC